MLGAYDCTQDKRLEYVCFGGFMIRGTNKLPVEEQVYNCIKKYNLINNGDIILVGVSGGPDSICLLYALNSLKEKLGIKIYVAHINHMIREEADLETKYVQNFCEKLEIECFVKKVDVQEFAKIQKQGTEEAGRNIRYEFFDEVSKKIGAKKIATAHNSNDKAETVLLNILRGSGISGLKGIEPIRDNKYIRPLIETSREDIEEYCEVNNLEPKIDKSNLESIYSRNKVRNDLIPYIQKEFNSNIIKTINRLSEVTTEENEYLELITENQFRQILVGADTSVCPGYIQENQTILDLKKFNNLELVIKRRVILYTIRKVIGSTQGIEKVNIDEIIKLCQNNIGNKYLTPTKNIKILVKNKKIFFISIKRASVSKALI